MEKSRLDREQSGSDAQIARERQIYFLEAIGTGLVKIGFAVNLKRRVSSFQTASAVPLQLIGLIPGGYEREQEIHNHLEYFRSHGEWFRRCDLMDELIATNGNRLKEARACPHRDAYIYKYFTDNFMPRPSVQAGLDAVELV